MSGKQTRKNAFREGFIHAMREAERLRRMGFTRLDEVVNILEMHAGLGLKTWSLQPGEAYESTAPKAWTGSTWWEIREMVLTRGGRRCVRCGSTEELHVDHIQPVAKGGMPRLENLQVLCKTCNLQKGASTLRAKNCGHTLHDATRSSHVAPATATPHHHPFRGVAVARGSCDSADRSCDFSQEDRQAGT